MSDDLAGRRLGKYELRAEIGRGGMGRVYLAYDPLLDRPVAIKVLAPHLVWEKDFVERFLREARAAARLQHPNIITIYDVGHEGDVYYFVMEYVQGQSLAEVIKRRGPLSPAEAVALLRPLAAALDHAHRQGLIHRDLKPGNVLVGAGGQACLTDFGIARAAQESRLTSSGTLIGTPEYMSPEQARGDEVDHRADLYSLAIVAYEMLGGRVPFGGSTPHGVLYRQVNDPPPSIRDIRPDLPPAVEGVFARALAKQPVARYDSASAMVQALERALAAAPGRPPAAPPGARDRSSTGEPTLYADRPPHFEKPKVHVDRQPQPAPVRVPAPQSPGAGPRPSPHPVPRRAGRRRRAWPWAALVLAVLLAAAAGAYLLWPGAAGPVAASPTPPAAAPTRAPAAPVAELGCDDDLGCVVVEPGAPIRLGYLLALSGDIAGLGIDAQRGAELAIVDRPEVRGHPVELVGEDGGCNPDMALAAAGRLGRDPGLVAVVGPTCSDEARPVIPIFCQAGIALVSPSNTAIDLTAQDRPPDYWCYLRTVYNDAMQGQVAARFVREVLGLSRVATVHEDRGYSGPLQRVFVAEFEALGGTITTQEVIAGDGGDAGPVLERVAATGPELIYFPLFLEAGVALTVQARRTPGLETVALLGADGLFSRDFLQAAGESARGFLWSSPDLAAYGPEYEGFVNRYRDRYGEMPIGPFHAQAYDAATMILAAVDRVARQAPDGRLSIPRRGLVEALLAVRGMPGLTGTLACSPTGDCAEPRIAIYEAVSTDADQWNPGAGPGHSPQRIWP